MPDGDRIFRNTALSSITPYSNSTTSEGYSLLTNTGATGSITALGISNTPANVLVYGTSNGKVYKMINAHTGNPTATEITGAGFPSGYISCVTIDPADADRIFITFSNYNIKSIFFSSDGCVVSLRENGGKERYENSNSS